MNDGFHPRRNQPVYDTSYLPAQWTDGAVNMFADAATRSTARPVSWHPTSHLVQNQVLPQTAVQYSVPAYSEIDFMTGYPQFPPTPAAYSGYTSPSTFSPVSLPYSGFEAQPYFSPNAWAMSVGVGPGGLPSPVASQPRPDEAAALLPQRSHEAPPDAMTQWNSFVSDGFDRCSAPPTPDDTYPITADKYEPRLPAEEAIPFQPLEEDEPEGEILIGMGLYDPPEKEVTDPTLESYRTSVAHLLGSAYKYPESTGKGLKLEDAWEPPEIEDEEEEDDEEEQERDAEGDESDSDES